MKAHIGLDASSRLVHSVHTTTVSVQNATIMTELMHGEEQAIVSDAASNNMILKAHCRAGGLFHLIADRAAKLVNLSDKQGWTNRHRSSVRTKAEFPFRIIKQLWGHTKACYRGLAKNTARLPSLFALSNLLHARRAAARGCLIPHVHCPTAPTAMPLSRS